MTTLKDVLLLAKENGMRVQIETKPSRKKPGLEEEVLRLVDETGMHERIMIISMHSDSIRRIRAHDPEILTAHAVMSAWKDYADVEDADNLSAEIGTITPLLVHELHEAGMEVFCWTADEPSDIQYLVSCGVDVIGTDDPVMVNTMLERSDCSGGFRRGIYLLIDMFADMVR
jgi:glycerophosphoryl diester phosphodiesterase